MPAAQMNSAGYTPDEKDYQILKVLEADGRLSIREVAAKVHLSATPTLERIRRLEQNGVIMQYGALLNHKKINKGIIVICQVSLKEHNRKAAKQFLDKIHSFKEVLECYNIAGDFDFMLKIVSESMETYHDFFVNKLSEVPHIGHTKSIFVMNVMKQTHQML